MKKYWNEFAFPLAVSALVGGLANYAGFPGGWLTGAMIAAIIFTFSGKTVEVPKFFLNGLFLFLGISFGSAVTPETLQLVVRWPLTIAILLATLALVVAISSLYFHRVGKWDKTSSMLGSIPGGLSMVLAMAGEMKVDAQRIAISQSLRVFVLMLSIPLFLDGNPSQLPQHSLLLFGPDDAVIVLFAALAGFSILKLLGAPAAIITGSTLGSALMFAFGYAEGSPPEWAITFAYVMLGFYVGSRLSGIPWQTASRYLALALGAFVCAIVISLGGAYLASLISGIEFSLLILAFAPGSFEAMAALALALNYDPAFVIAHHLVRFFAIALIAPLLVGWARRDRK